MIKCTLIDAKLYIRVITNLVSCNVPISDKRIVGIVKRREVGHLDRATIRILSLSQELIDGVDSIRLNSIIGSEDNELRHVRLPCPPVRSGM